MKVLDFHTINESLASSQNAFHLPPDAKVNSFYSKVGKRFFDLILAAAMLPVLFPIIFTLWALTRMDGGRGFFAHRRIGQNGKVFRCWKIRTMVMDSEKRLRDYLVANPDADREWRESHKLTNDPRVTPIGKFIRATSLDELPQIWNILRGDMSFVGPRPVVRMEMHKYGDHRSSYQAMRPGLTGLWQVSGRNDVSYQERIDLDIDYICRISLRVDALIILKTVSAVLNRTGR